MERAVIAIASLLVLGGFYFILKALARGSRFFKAEWESLHAGGRVRITGLLTGLLFYGMAFYFLVFILFSPLLIFSGEEEWEEKVKTQLGLLVLLALMYPVTLLSMYITRKRKSFGLLWAEYRERRSPRYVFYGFVALFWINFILLLVPLAIWTLAGM